MVQQFEHDRRTFLAAALAAIGAAGMPFGATAQDKSFANRKLVATVFGGRSMEVMQSDVFDKLTAETGMSISGVPLLSGAAFARMKAEANGPQIDLFNFSGGQQTQAKRDGLTQSLTGMKMMDKVPPTLRDPDGHWVSWGVIAEGILYRTDKISTPPTSYLDFLKPEYKGHVAFPAISNGYGVDFLVMLARANGGSEKDIGPGFELLKRIAADAAIFKAAPDVQTQFAQNDIWIMPYDAASAMVSSAMGLPVAFAAPKEGVPTVRLAGCVTKNSQNSDLACAMLDRLLAPEVQLRLAKVTGWVPVNSEVVLPAELAAALPSQDKFISLDRDVINAQVAGWVDRFSKEIAR
ncbi:conserved exported hypothetical protein [Hyphomicrobiales bacterium]|nr:conserved exported hypothetical protein [Hyphomicrobiales bacterium]CAH1691088.1 conserved exported hypothetical protein [Hyphomicrobiales bacterium]